MSGDRDRERGAKSWRQAVSTIGLALAIPWTIAIPALLGWYLDKRFETWPILLLIGLLLGLVGAGLDIYQLMKRFSQLK